jgi:uncharacterized membrane protein
MNSAIRTRAASCAVLVAALGVLASVATAAETPLTNGVPVTGLSGSAGVGQYFRIDVPAGQDSLQISTSGGTGDVDLYVKRGSLPTTTSYDYRPYKVGNNETVDVNNPASGTWYIMLRGYTNYAGVTLKATYAAALSVKALTNGVAATGISGAANMELYYSVDVPAGQSKLEIAMSGGTGDADLYVKKGSLPTTTSYDYRPFLSGNNETVNVENPEAATWYIMIRGYSDFAGITLLASYGGGSGTVLQNGVPVTNLSGAAGSEKQFRFDLPAGQKNLQIQMSGGTGDADLYVRLKSPPTTTEYDYRPFQAGNNETVTVDAPTAGTWFVMIRGYSDYAGVTLKASWGDGTVTALQDEMPVTNLSGSLSSEKFFQFDVPAGQDSLEFRMSGGSGNADMYIKKGAKPTTSSYDYRPVDNGNTESIRISSSALEGTWYVMLKAAKAYDGVTLVGDYSVSKVVITLSNGVPVTGIAASTGGERYYRIDVPSNQQKFEIRISGGTGDADLYVKQDSIPTTTDYDYRPNLLGNNEAVTIDNPIPGAWYIMIRAHQSFAGVTLLATYGGTTPEAVITLQNGVPVTGISGTASGEKHFRITVPSGQAKLEIVMSGGTGDADLYVRKGSQATTTEWDYRPYLIGNNESVTINAPTAATYYIMIRGYSAFDGVTLRATYTAAPEQVTALTNGLPVTGLSGPSGSEQFYRIDVPSGQDYLTIETSGGTGDVDLYVKRGSKPTLTSWDYRPYLIGNSEKVEVPGPAAATWYIMLRGYQAYTGVTLTATYGGKLPSKGNNFASDPNCVALWRFESGQLTTDSIGTNTLANHGVTANMVNMKEGASSAEFMAADGDYFSIANASLSPRFPLKTDDKNRNISVSTWFRMASLPDFYQYVGLFTKSDEAAGKTSFAIAVGRDKDGKVNVWLMVGHDGGVANSEWVPHTSAIVSTDTWYHLGVTYRDSDRSYRIRLSNGETTTETTGTVAKGISLFDAPVFLGNITGLNWALDGQLDEMAVFNDVLTPAEIDQIRQGSYTKAK